MIVHLIASIQDSRKDTDYLRRIVEVIHDQGGVLAHNWLESAVNHPKENTCNSDWEPRAETSLEALKRSDIVIIDLTHYTFSQGFMVAAAIECKKPILAISRESIKSTLAGGIEDSLFNYKKYSTTDELTSAVRSFILQNTIHTKDLRFNMFLTRRTSRYLDDTSRETSRSRSEIIREIIKRKDARRGNRG